DCDLPTRSALSVYAAVLREGHHPRIGEGIVLNNISEVIELTVRFEPDEQKVWKHIPFQMPAGVDQFHISIEYNDRIDSNPWLTGGNTLDVGLFDPQGIESCS